MDDSLLKLTILFFVIFDPLASMLVFFSATGGMEPRERMKTAFMSIFVAASISYVFLFFGEKTIYLFGVTMNDFKAASGIILNILGIKMISGLSFTQEDMMKKTSSHAIASIIGTPLLTGPAAITTIIISVRDYGKAATGASIAIVLVLTAVLFIMSSKLKKVLNETTIRVLTTFLGLVTISWGVKFIREALGNL